MACTPDPTAASFAFGPFELIPERQLLLKDQAPVRIGGRALDLLTVLVQRSGDLVSKRELLARAWPDTVVEECNLKVNMSALRRALGEGSDGEPYIATVTGRGYRFIAPVQVGGRQHNLPTSTTRIVGRAEAIEATRQELAQSRLVSIVGAGGIGKTTVALAVAEHCVGSYRDGVWLVDLTPLNDPVLVANGVAAAIGLSAHSPNMLAALCRFLRDRTMLLVLDNCEHIVDAVATCANRILADAPGIRILATSREPLGVKGERVRRLPGLGTPPASSHLKAVEALAFPAVQLFVDRASDRRETFRLSDADAPLVAELCRRLDGLALAIELAATRTDAFGIGELLDQLDDRFRLLEGHRAGPQRHRTLRATIDWSYDLLSASERAVMRRLSTFAGAFTLASACAVAAGDGIDRPTVIEDLANLVAKSLVSAEAREIEVEYRLLDTTRSYASEKLAADDEFDDARRRHAEYFLDLAERANADAARLTACEWLTRHAANIADIRDALRWAYGSPATASLGLRLTIAAIAFWERLSLLEECRAAVARALDSRFVPCRSERDELVLQLTLGAALLHTRGPLLEVKAAFAKALQIAEASGDTDLRLACLRGLSEYSLWTGDARAVLSLSEQIRAIANAAGRITAGVTADAQAGSALRYLGNLAGSRNQLENMVDRRVPYDAHSDTARFEFDQRLTARGSLAAVLWLQGFPDQAVEMARRQCEEAEASNRAVSLCSAFLLTSCVISLYVGDLRAAGRFLDLARNHATEHGLTVWNAVATCLRGRWSLECGNPFELEAYRNALAELYQGGFRIRYPSYLAIYGEGLAQQGELDRARLCLDEAIALSESSGQVWGIPEMLRMKGNLIRTQGHRGSSQVATDCYVRSIACARKLGAPSWELRSTTSLVELWREIGGNEQAEAMLASTYGRFREGFGTRDLRRARCLLDDLRSG